ncbi:MAG TPA: hypothetical protein VD999_00930 [Vitreimonas sp.]|nr:hypothetical protein [Vitreimonas sp.]
MTTKKSSSTARTKYVTEQRLKEILDERFTAFGAEMSEAILTGVQRMFDEQNKINKATFATKKELQELCTELKTEISEVKSDAESFKSEMRAFRSETIGRFADVMGELQAIREEQTVIVHQLTKHRDKLDEHDHEITTIKTHLKLA